jgi:hypothetical protein
LLITPLVSCLWFTVVDYTFGILSLIYSCWLHLWYLVFDLQRQDTKGVISSCKSKTRYQRYNQQLQIKDKIPKVSSAAANQRQDVSCLWFTAADYTFGILSLICSCWWHLWYLVFDLQLLITPFKDKIPKV